MTDGAKRDDGGSRRAGRGERDREAAAKRPVFLDPSDTACAGREISPLQTARQAHLMAPSYALMTTCAHFDFRSCAPRERDDRQSRVIFAHVLVLGWFFVCARVRMQEAMAFQSPWKTDLGLRSYALITTCLLYTSDAADDS